VVNGEGVKGGGTVFFPVLGRKKGLLGDEGARESLRNEGERGERKKKKKEDEFKIER